MTAVIFKSVSGWLGGFAEICEIGYTYSVASHCIGIYPMTLIAVVKF
ncbi:hypothetical protein shim_31680 [Shimia sp. SK013]|nr:hypothetical protein shim_31680 [Shimia sp. SK013]